MSDTESEIAVAAWLASLPAKTFEPKDCRHLDFAAFCGVQRLEDTGKFYAEVRVVCRHCHEPMRFLGLEPGVVPGIPTCSIDGLEALLPIEPEVEKRLFAGARYVVDQTREAKH